MPFLGTIVNFFVVLICGILGTFIKAGVPKRIGDIIMSGMAACVLYIGIDGVLEAAPAVVSEASMFSDSLDSLDGLVKIIVMIISMALGSLIGELIDIDKQLNRLGHFLEAQFEKLGARFGRMSVNGKSAPAVDDEQAAEGKTGSFAKGFVSCSLLFCVGAMAADGALRDALGNPDVLLAKSVIDGITCTIMASTLGIGCAFSAFFVLAYQGVITLIGLSLSGILSDATISYMSATGSLVVILVGTNVLGATKIKTANMIPVIFMPIAVAPLIRLIFG